METRQAEQCRSHHQKMEKKYHKFTAILINLRMQQYGTMDTEPMITEMLECNINVHTSLTSAEELVQQN